VHVHWRVWLINGREATELEATAGAPVGAQTNRRIRLGSLAGIGSGACHVRGACLHHPVRPCASCSGPPPTHRVQHVQRATAGYAPDAARRCATRVLAPKKGPFQESQRGDMGSASRVISLGSGAKKEHLNRSGGAHGSSLPRKQLLLLGAFGIGTGPNIGSGCSCSCGDLKRQGVSSASSSTEPGRSLRQLAESKSCRHYRPPAAPTDVK
jgi:hypothetical protein